MQARALAVAVPPYNCWKISGAKYVLFFCLSEKICSLDIA
jgi:hypothetical protein